MSDQPATIGAKFTVVRPLGKGGMGTVFEAVDAGTGQRVAVKVIASDMAGDPSIVSRFQREVRTASALDTPHIVRVVEAGIDPISQLPFMAMEYLEGEDLRQLLKRLGPLPPDLALRITAQACKALHAAHSAKILHRDIKPANLFLAKQGDLRVVKLLDFGVAKVQHGELHGDAEMTGLTRTGSMIGSPLYMSPEQARGYRDLDGRTDIWSLGVVLYQMLSGRTPHKKIDQLGELLVRICTQPPPPIQRRAPWVPPAVASLLTHALAMEADDRIPSASALLESVEMLLKDGSEIPEEALRPLSDHEKQIVAEVTHLERTGPAPVDPLGLSGAMGLSGSHPSRTAPSVFPAPDIHGGDGGGDSATATGRTSGGRRSSTLTSGATSLSEHTAVPPAPPDRKLARMAVIGLLAGAMAAGVYFGLGRSSAPAGGAAQPAEGARERTVKLVIWPKDAKVEVAGKPAEVTDGMVEITGAPGSVHKVRVTAGEAQKQVDVVVSDSGPVPAKVEIASTAAPVATPSAPPAAVEGQQATAQPVIHPPLTGPKPKPTATATATTTPAATQTGRTLRDER